MSGLEVDACVPGSGWPTPQLQKPFCMTPVTQPLKQLGQVLRMPVSGVWAWHPLGSSLAFSEPDSRKSPSDEDEDSTSPQPLRALFSRQGLL